MRSLKTNSHVFFLLVLILGVTSGCTRETTDYYADVCFVNKMQDEIRSVEIGFSHKKYTIPRISEGEKACIMMPIFGDSSLDITLCRHGKSMVVKNVGYFAKYLDKKQSRDVTLVMKKKPNSYLEGSRYLLDLQTEQKSKRENILLEDDDFTHVRQCEEQNHE